MTIRMINETEEFDTKIRGWQSVYASVIRNVRSNQYATNVEKITYGGMVVERNAKWEDLEIDPGALIGVTTTGANLNDKTEDAEPSPTTRTGLHLVKALSNLLGRRSSRVNAEDGEENVGTLKKGSKVYDTSHYGIEGWVNYGNIDAIDIDDALTCCGDSWSEVFYLPGYFSDTSLFDREVVGGGIYGEDD